MRIARLFSLLILTLSLCAASTAWAGATFYIYSYDSPGEGFYDLTPVAPVGGNPGTTRGEQIQNVFEMATQIWGAKLESSEVIYVAELFNSLFCTPTRAVLGSAGAGVILWDDTLLPIPYTWYSSAETDALVGFDAYPPAWDIIANFNNDLGMPGCLDGQSWYLGLDHKNDETSEIDLLAVVTHELAHGLGFFETVDESTGEQIDGLPDVYQLNMYDTTQGLYWDQMTDAERLASQVNWGGLVWRGPNVTYKAPMVLDPRPVVYVKNAGPLKGSYTAQNATFGPRLRTDRGTSGRMKVVKDKNGGGTLACGPIKNNLSNKIALIDRGACPFTTKVLNAQKAGARAAIIVNNEPTGLPGMTGYDPAIKIPSVGVSMADGNTFMSAAQGHINGTLILDDNFMAGADDNGNVLLYAPNPVQPGSSKSHFDTSATPNLLMEPAVNDDLAPRHNLDLTVPLLKDIGWPTP